MTTRKSEVHSPITTSGLLLTIGRNVGRGVDSWTRAGDRTRWRYGLRGIGRLRIET
ncbi:unnamed protein product [Linum tenue]|uniref:Uncharacterized protein n=1 Tax=Linum tenue TaxID=586396 RepID=A0AAV0N2V7_9ROSI|nr:unnamed protein product [Linum tenue]